MKKTAAEAVGLTAMCFALIVLMLKVFFTIIM